MRIDMPILRVCALFVLFVGLVAGQTEVLVGIGRRAVLTCNARYVTAPYRVTWEKEDGTFLSNDKEYEIPVVQARHAGTYVCRVVNVNRPEDVATSKLYLSIRDESGRRIGPTPTSGSGNVVSIESVKQKSEQLRLGGVVFRLCNITDPTGGSWSVFWQKDNQTVGSGRYLYLSPLTMSHSGVYQCVGINRATGRKMTHQLVLLASDIDPRLAGRQPFPAVAQSGSGYEIRIKRISLNPMVLQCVVLGSSSSGWEFEWRKDGRIVSRGSKLTVNTVDASSGGKYECVAKGQGSRGGFSRSTGSYDHRVLVKQRETKISLSTPPGPTHIVEIGANKELHCELDQTRDGQEKAMWFVQRKGAFATSVPLIPPAATIYPSPSVSILVLQNVQESDSGRYECRVERGGRVIIRDASLVVVSDVGLEVYPSTLTYTLGVTRNNPEFHCQVDNLPGGASRLSWSFIPRGGSAEQPLPENVRIIKRPGVVSTSYINVENPTRANYGYYVCRTPGGDTGRGILIVRGNIIRNAVVLDVKPGKVVTVDPGQTARILCYSRSHPNIVPSWTVPARFAGQVSRSTQGRNRILLFSRVRPDQSGTQFTCHHKNEGKIIVTIRVNAGCPVGQRRCRSGICISDSLFCNGRRDCPDGSDESKANCAACEPNEVECQRHNGRVPAKKCIPIHWVCDGENDCGNGFDERRCSGRNCEITKFQCSTRDFRSVIVRGFHCDGDKDCSGGTDEYGCSAPTIVRPTSRDVNLRRRVSRGAEVRLECEAIGVPVPRIIWRYNWGFVVASHEINEQCLAPKRALSTLILKSVTVSDAGIYSCEALNNPGRAFGEDYVVEVNGR